MSNFPFNHFLKSDSLISDGEVAEKRPTNKGESLLSNNEHLLNDNDYLSLENELETELKRIIGPLKFDLYFSKLFKISKVTDKEIFISLFSSYIKNQVESNFGHLIKSIILNILGKSFNIIYLVKEDGEIISSKPKQKQIVSKQPKIEIPLIKEEKSEKAPLEKKSVKEATFTLDLAPTKEDLLNTAESKYINHLKSGSSNTVDSKKVFDNFIVGPSNNMAYVTMKGVAASPSRPGHQNRYPTIYIYSGSGLGKTHLLHSVANEIKDQFPELTVWMTSAREFMKEMINSIQNNKLEQFQKKYCNKVDVLLIDDIHELENKHGTQNEFFHIFNEFHTQGKQLIFTSDKSPGEINGIAERVRTRLQWGLVVDMQAPDLETRIAIIKNKANEIDLFLPEDSMVMIAENISNSIRELEGSLVKLSAYSEVMKVDIDTEVVKELLVLPDNPDEVQTTIEDIARTTAQYFKIPLADLKSKARTKPITQARHVAMYLCQKVIAAKLQDIGEFFSGRDHTTVLHGIKKISKEFPKDHRLSRDVVEIQKSI